MNLTETIENIRATCNNYADPELVAIVINDECLMKTNNILEITDKYGINDEDDYNTRIFKILEHEHVFLTMGMYSFVPVINECDIYSTEDYNFTLTPEEFEIYAHEKERLFGILIKKGGNDYIIGSTDICSCSIDSSFIKIEKTDMEFNKKLEKIIKEKIIG